MRILVASSLEPRADGNGSELQVWHTLRELARRHEVRVVHIGEHGVHCSRGAIAVGPLPRKPPCYRLGAAVAAPLTGAPLLVRELQATAFERTVRDEAARFLPDCLYVTNGPAAYVRRAVTGVPAVLNVIDAWSLNTREIYASRERHIDPYGSLVVRGIRRFERTYLPAFDDIVTVSTNDRDWLTALTPGIRAHAISNGVDHEFYQPDRASGEPPREFQRPNAPKIVFHGTMDYSPNVDAAVRLVEEIMPLVWSTLPRARVGIVGRSPAPRVLALRQQRVEVTGSVPDIRPHLDAAAVAIYPLRTGSGVKNKVLEAASMARPIVMTPSALGDLDLVHGRHAWMADGTSELAAGIVHLATHRDEAAPLGRNARALIIERHSWPRLGDRLEEVISEAVHARRFV